MTNNASFMATLEHPCMITRLGNEIREAAREFREGPRAFITSALKSGRGSGRRTSLLRFGLAVGLLVYAFAFSAMLALWYGGHRQQLNREISVTNIHETLYTLRTSNLRRMIRSRVVVAEAGVTRMRQRQGENCPRLLSIR